MESGAWLSRATAHCHWGVSDVFDGIHVADSVGYVGVDD